MATAAKVKPMPRQDSLYSVNVYDVKFFKLKDQAEAWCQIKYEAKMHRGEVRQEMLELPVLSLWLDEVSGHAAKAHLHAYGNDKGLRDFVDICKREGGIDFSIRSQEFTVDRSGMVMRLGVRYDQYQSKSDDTWDRIPVYDSKAMAVDAAIQAIASSVPLGGTELINYNAVPDAYMEQFGFEKVPDMLGVGVPMWKGKPDAIIKKSGYGGYSYERDKKNRAGFLDLIQQALAEDVTGKKGGKKKGKKS